MVELGVGVTPTTMPSSFHLPDIGSKDPPQSTPMRFDDVGCDGDADASLTYASLA
jgi:hypothetical protein